jgi:hypothetical protein
VVGAPANSADPFGELDPNGDRPIQKPFRDAAACAGIRGFATEDNANTWGGRFYDNGVYSIPTSTQVRDVLLR